MKTQINIKQNIAVKAAIITRKAKTIYDTKFENLGEAGIGGIFFLVTPILFTVFSLLNGIDWAAIQGYTAYIIIGATALRVIAAFWIASVAKELNRNQAQWIGLALFVPGIALTIIGQQMRIKDVNDYKQHLYTPGMKDLFQEARLKLQVTRSLQVA